MVYLLVGVSPFMAAKPNRRTEERKHTRLWTRKMPMYPSDLKSIPPNIGPTTSDS